ncbi:MAG: putative metal-binding motif-containing protein [Myxococcales bacterium]|nr:putative metal-binding motif-containing protein [Myxococcales bacterium]
MFTPATGGASAGRPALRAAFLFLFSGLALTGCPPTGDVPPFNPGEAGVPGDPCTDTDGDGYVVGESCALPAGDCDPEDPTRNPGAAEICNRQDDDCDRATDEGDPGGGDDCTTDQPGLCSAGRTSCEQGSIVCTQIEQRALREDCNGVDDDCDGSTDEDDPGGGGDCETGQAGRCNAGTERCVGGGLICVADVAADAEACNGVDDDCDGDTDEGDPEGGGACDTGLRGVCAVGVERCTGGDVTCIATAEAMPETCNGLDDDCDGSTDEAFPELGDACTVGEGACARDSVLVCAPDGGGTECDAAPGNDRPEACNGLDDDCDGSTDEDFPDLGDACEVGLGVCARPGELACSEDGTGTTCAGEPGMAGAERCNDLDDDCDGSTDEDFPGVGDDCVDDSGACPVRARVQCTADGAAATCRADADRPPEPEQCNDFDDDCDGRVDEDFVGKGDACEGGLGICARPGRNVCAPDGAGLVCDAEPGPAADEICNGADDDCDGYADNGAACPGPPTGRVNALRIAEFDEARCADLDGDGTPDNALGGVAGLFNQRLAAALGADTRALIVRAPGFPPPANQGFALEILEALVVDDGVVAAPRAISATGEALSAIGGVRVADGTLSTPNRGPAARLPSPLFYATEADAPYEAATFLQLATPGATGEIQADPDGNLTLRNVAVSGAIDRQALLDAWQAAADACAADPAAPADCGVFALVPPAVLAANLTADLDRDGRPGNDAVSVCLVLSTEPAASPPLGGQPCAVDAHCAAGLVCRAAPVSAGPQLGTSLQPRCGPPGPGDRGEGEACADDGDCRGGLCLATTAAGPRCTHLCGDDAPCGAGEACRGVAVDVPGALTQGGRSAAVCVPFAGSGGPCDGVCAGAEVCGVWLAGALATPGGVVEAEGRCERPSADGAALGATCDDAFDCVHGGGCVADLADALRCAAPCAAPADCAGDAVCVTRPLLDAAAGQPALEQGFCLPVPPEVGSGAACTADVDCPGTETCRAFALPGGDVERFCGRGQGFFTVGQPCDQGADCASGRCNGGFCGGLCADEADCGARLTCRADAVRDAAGRVLGGDCGGAGQACVVDRDCANAPGCAGGRCVCDQRACRIGCRFPGACPAGLYCQPDNTCAVYCRDDEAEPDDGPDEAGVLELGRRHPRIERTGTLCGTSAEDWMTFIGQGYPFAITLAATGDAPGLVLDAQLLDAFGAPLAEATVEDGPDGPVLRLAVDDAATARDLAGQPILLGIRGSGIVDAATYALVATLDFPACADPAAEPRDEPWEFTEIGTDPSPVAQQVINGAICAQDTDWYAVFLSNGDRLTVNLDVDDPAIAQGLEVDLIGPDHPRMPSARVQASIPAGLGGQLVFTPPALSCNLQTRFCHLADGTRTGVFCSNAPALCFGVPWYLRVRGAGAFDQSAYTLTTRVDRAQATQCVPDVHEQDEIFDLSRPAAALGPDADAEVAIDIFRDPVETLPMGKSFSLEKRACGGDDPDGFTDFDSIQVALKAGERLRVEVRQPGPVEQMVFAAYRFNPATGSLDLFGDALLINDAVFTQDVIAQDDNIYGVRVVRPSNPGGAYSYSLPYVMTSRRLPAGFQPDTGCASPTRLPLVGGRASVRGSTLGAEDDHHPLQCAGGLGPDRVYVIRPPAGAGRLIARVDADGADANDPSVSIRTGCAAENSELACNEDDGTAASPLRAARAEADMQGGRDVFIIVDSFDADRAGAYLLSLEWQAQ